MAVRAVATKLPATLKCSQIYTNMARQQAATAPSIFKSQTVYELSLLPKSGAIWPSPRCTEKHHHGKRFSSGSQSFTRSIPGSAGSIPGDPAVGSKPFHSGAATDGRDLRLLRL